MINIAWQQCNGRAKKRYEQAESLYRRALNIREKALGPAHPEVAIILNNLSRTARHAVSLSRVEPLYQRALAIREGSWPDHPDLARTLQRLRLTVAENRTESRGLSYESS